MTSVSISARQEKDFLEEDTPHKNTEMSLRSTRKWAIVSLSVVALCLIPWTLYLTYSLPSRHLTDHYDISWVGFDVLMVIMIVMTIISLLKGSRYLTMVSSLTAGLLLCDAWFDVTTSRGGELGMAIIQAVAAEIPLAFLCLWLARDAERLCARNSLVRKISD